MLGNPPVKGWVQRKYLGAGYLGWLIAKERTVTLDLGLSTLKCIRVKVGHRTPGQVSQPNALPHSPLSRMQP